MKISLPEYVEKALARLSDKGFLGYAVGGCVRDSLLKITPSDFDICTNALPEEMLALFLGYPIIPTGIEHGTVTVIIDGHLLEITTFREDGEYLNHRKPMEVVFSSSLVRDLERRDFTINALAYNEKDGLTDVFGGVSDLNSKIIRAVGDPTKRFSEDALRILRGVRFAATLGFNIEEKTFLAMRDLAPTLTYISHERICAEIKKLLLGKNAAAAMEENREVIFAVFPELADDSEFSFTLRALNASPKKLSIRLALLLQRSNSSDILARLRFENSLTRRVLALISHIDEPVPFTTKQIKKLAAAMGTDGLIELLETKKQTLPVERLQALADAKMELDRIISEGECFSLSTLAINGSDLLELGFSESRELGRTLQTLLELVIDGGLENQRESLLKKANILKEHQGQS